MNELEIQIRWVAETRKARGSLEQQKNDRQQKWMDENLGLLSELTEATGRVVDAEVKLRELTLQAYAVTGNKAPAVGVSVKIFQVLNYDPTEAKKWATAHGIALKLDVTTFEKLAKVEEPAFVNITEEPRAQIAQNLE